MSNAMHTLHCFVECTFSIDVWDADEFELRTWMARREKVVDPLILRNRSNSPADIEAEGEKLIAYVRCYEAIGACDKDPRALWQDWV